MTSLNTRLRNFGRSLAGVAPHTSVYHYRKPDRHKPPYIVWMEDGEDDQIYFDGRKEEQAISGTVDLYTLAEYDAAVDGIQNLLHDVANRWSLTIVQYEEETNLIHYHWEWVIL